MVEKNKPFIINLYKPKNITSYDVIRKWKPRLKQFGKVGHFGTLDPFASGVLMLGVAGGQRLNEYIHECLPKTYLAQGVLGQETETGDLTVAISQRDDSDYLQQTIKSFTEDFIEKTLQQKFIGEYYQSPHKYSAAKFEGKPLHEWARAGVEIKKEKVRREIYQIEVVKYDFPHLWIRFQVSSGTYIRTLFAECANTLGTIGVLEGLIREKVGGCTVETALRESEWEQTEIPKISVETVLSMPNIVFANKEAILYQNGVRLNLDRAQTIEENTSKFNYYWVKNLENELLGMAEISDGQIISKVNFL